jgi:hypothetical protein
MTWSPQAYFARRDAKWRAALWDMRLSPKLYRTADTAVLMWPEYGRRRHQEAVRKWIAEKLPAFKFNKDHNWFEAPLSELGPAAELLPKANLSDGVRAHLGLTG